MGTPNRGAMLASTAASKLRRSDSRSRAWFRSRPSVPATSSATWEGASRRIPPNSPRAAPRARPQRHPLIRRKFTRNDPRLPSLAGAIWCPPPIARAATANHALCQGPAPGLSRLQPGACHQNPPPRTGRTLPKWQARRTRPGRGRRERGPGGRSRRWSSLEPICRMLGSTPCLPGRCRPFTVRKAGSALNRLNPATSRNRSR